MTFLITESIIKFTDDLSAKNIIILFVSVLIFIAVSIISGIVAYKIKIKKLRQNQKEKENTDKTDKG